MVAIRESAKKAAGFVYNDFSSYSSVTNMLELLEWPTLEQRRKYLCSVQDNQQTSGNGTRPNAYTE